MDGCEPSGFSIHVNECGSLDAIAPLPLNSGHLEKYISLSATSDSTVNDVESKREQSGINRRQFHGVDGVAAIFRGPLVKVVSFSSMWNGSGSPSWASRAAS